jgi:hypothetical protein
MNPLLMREIRQYPELRKLYKSHPKTITFKGTTATPEDWIEMCDVPVAQFYQCACQHGWCGACDLKWYNIKLNKQ